MVRRAGCGHARRGVTKGMPTKMFVNLPVKHLARTVEFFSKLGYKFNPQFTNDDATCMIISDTNFAMLLTEPFFKTFVPAKAIVDATTHTEVLVALSCESADEVKQICERAFAAGATRYCDPKDHGFMYQWGFQDLDGHIWEYFWMDPANVQ